MLEGSHHAAPSVPSILVHVWNTILTSAADEEAIRRRDRAVTRYKGSGVRTQSDSAWYGAKSQCRCDGRTISAGYFHQFQAVDMVVDATMIATGAAAVHTQLYKQHSTV